MGEPEHGELGIEGFTERGGMDWVSSEGTLGMSLGRVVDVFFLLEVLDRTIEIGGNIFKVGFCICATTKRAGVRVGFSSLVVEPQSLTQSWDPAE